MGRGDDHRRLFAQSAASFGPSPSEKRHLSFHAPGFFASSFRFVAPSPIGKLIDVRNRDDRLAGEVAVPDGVLAKPFSLCVRSTVWHRIARKTNTAKRRFYMHICNTFTDCILGYDHNGQSDSDKPSGAIGHAISSGITIAHAFRHSADMCLGGAGMRYWPYPSGNAA